MSVIRGNSGRSIAEQPVEVVWNGAGGTNRAGKARGSWGLALRCGWMRSLRRLHRGHFGVGWRRVDAISF